MDAASSLPSPLGNIEPVIRAANSTPHRNNLSQPVSDPTRAANNQNTLSPPVADITVDDAVCRIRAFEDPLQVDRVRPGLIHIAANRVVAANRDYSLDGDGLRRLCQSLGAPHVYLKTVPPVLRSDLLQYHVDQRLYANGKRRDDEATTIISRNGRFLAFGRCDLQTLAGSEVLSAVVDAIDEPPARLAVSRLSFVGESVAIEIVSRRVATEVEPGDVICGGVRVQHCHLGTEATLLHSFVLRLVCANGLVHRECTGPRRTPRTRRLPTGPQA